MQLPPKVKTSFPAEPNTNPNHSSPSATNKLGSARSMVNGPSKEIPPCTYSGRVIAPERPAMGETGKSKPLTDFKAGPGFLM